MGIKIGKFFSRALTVPRRNRPAVRAAIMMVKGVLAPVIKEVALDAANEIIDEAIKELEDLRPKISP